ncbi:MAG: hypothetical protein A3H98_10705 [Bacteroidetes bacterium RIFCSPLOWO2_02_FULL_36_8]|nr:MAG: hypothetical protein A3H98_10705 [Bacteroidetes bacterium RIFCSPLOWO2_02_FULL_36_8]OFY69769.1 MAG: hypothetical protein A3G23_11490 [Bacteroidetes bacterium RIFCSPLOWO2_12_FULL_37_12]
MKLLLDTQAFIWFSENDKSLSQKIKNEIEDTDNLIMVSIASLWEMTIKMGLGKLKLSCDIEKMIEKLYQNGFELLTILPDHLIKLSTLNLFHRNPFDRIIISQGLYENIRIISSDPIFDEYGVRRVWY